MPDNNQRTPDNESEKKTTPTPEEEKKTPQAGEDGKQEDPQPKKNEGKEEDKKENFELSEKEWKEYQALKRINSKKPKKSSSKKSSDDGKFSFEEPEDDEPDEQEVNMRELEETTRLKIGISDLLVDNDEYRNVVKANKTLGKVLRNDPLAILDEQPIDAQDAVDKISEFLDDLVVETKSSSKEDKKEDKEEKKPAPKAPETKGDEDIDKKENNEPKTRYAGMQTVEDKLKNKFTERIQK